MNQSALSAIEGAANEDVAPSVDPHAILFIPRRRRFLHNYVQTAEGKMELVVHFADKEITFDEPDLFPFAENLCKQDSFMAASATFWSQGAPYEWERVKELLEALVAEGLVTRDEGAAGRDATHSENYLEHIKLEAKREAPSEPMWWNPGCAAALRKIAGRPLELGYMETVVPVYRLAHPALDAEGRHVGEMNTYPAAMRMRLPTETRFCKYPGGRYDYDLPMNMTALNAMRVHWRSMMQGILLVREEVLRRYPLGADGVWRIGDLHTLSCAQLAVTTLLLMRGDDPVPNGALDPVLSSIFRVSDGVRMVTAYAIHFIDDPRPYDSSITAADLLHITEARDHFLSNHGACAGPPKMMEEFLATIIDGKPLEGEAPPLGDWVSEIPRAVDYALHGIMLHSALSSLWLRMALAYRKIHAALGETDPPPESPLARLRARVERDWISIQPSHLDRPPQCDWEESRFTELFERAQQGIRGATKIVRLADVLTPPPDLLGSTAAQALRTLVRAGAGDGAPPQVLDQISDAALEYLRVERSVLHTVVAVQRRINALLWRAHPTSPLSGTDLAIHHTLRVGTPGALPYLMSVFHDELGIETENTERSTRLTRGATSIDLY